MSPKIANALSISALIVLVLPPARGGVTTFFDTSQSVTNVASGDTSETLATGGYLFTRTLDKWWYPTISLGPGTPTGRPERVVWPSGLEAQAITAGPSGPVTGQSHAKITIERADGTPFDITSFSTKILASTAGAGAAFEIMPKRQGEDGLPDPLMFDATGYAGKTFTYSDLALTGFDFYEITLWVDFALVGLTVVDASPAAAPVLQISKTTSSQVRLSWSSDASGFTLQESPDVQSNHFTNSGTAPVIDGNERVVLLPSSGSARLWRLAK